MKHLLCLVSALLMACSAMAVPAHPGILRYTQPDGSIVLIELHGDEFVSWATLAGTDQVVARDKEGYWRPATLSPATLHAGQQRRAEANAERRNMRPATHTDNPLTHGEHHIPVFLVQFQDVRFSLSNPAQKFNDMLNKEGYSEYNASGSVRDYFLDNSHGEYQPVFDVYGPVTLPYDMAWYGEQVQQEDGSVEHDKQPEMALFHAAQLLDDSVDFSQYDADNDGKIDMILFYYAGYSQAEGASTDAIWPHQWNFQAGADRTSRNTRFDGVKLAKYFCTAELRGKEGKTMCGIGVTAHEFSHSLGLPDFYDADYETNGICSGMYYFSLMSNGSYLNDSRTPPYFNAIERIDLGWMTGGDLRSFSTGDYVIGSIRDDIAYQIPTSTEGEYFLLECRDAKGWDAALPAGLMVYHVDRSTSRMVNGKATPQQLWNSHKVNIYGDHPCCYVVPASAQDNLNYKGAYAAWLFPGSGHVSTYTPIDWNGVESNVCLDQIKVSGEKVSLYARIEGAYTEFGQIGIPAIADPGCGNYKSGDSFQLVMTLPVGRTPDSLAWRFDGTDKTGAKSVTLTAGDHHVTAVVKWPEGETETFDLQIHVQ